ncbi:MAG: hypothetical protein RR292_05925, partial [Christensenellaceae bacterium]
PNSYVEVATSKGIEKHHVSDGQAFILIDDGVAFYASDTAKDAVFHENYHQIAQRMSIIMINEEERSIQI